MSMSPEKLAEHKELWAKRWEIADKAAAEDADLQVIAEEYGVALNSVRNYKRVAIAFPRSKRKASQVPFSVHEKLASKEDRYDLVKAAAAEARTSSRTPRTREPVEPDPVEESAVEEADEPTGEVIAEIEVPMSEEFAAMDTAWASLEANAE